MTTTNQAATTISTPDEDALLIFFAADNISEPDFCTQFPKLDYDDTLRLMGEHPKLSPHHRKRARGAAEALPQFVNVYVEKVNNLYNVASPPNVTSPPHKRQRRQSQPLSDEEEFGESGPDKEVDDEEPNEDASMDQASQFSSLSQLSASQFELPSKKTLLGLLREQPPNITKDLGPGIIFIDDSLGDSPDYKYLKSLVKVEARPSNYFLECLKAWAPFIGDPKDYNLIPSCPDMGNDPIERETKFGEWLYVSKNIQHYSRYLDIISTRAASHGEVYVDTHVWANLVDGAFLESNILTIDRRELCVAKIGTKNKFDGVLRPLKFQHGYTLGLIEMKPSVHDKPVESDRVKLIRSLAKIIHSQDKEGLVVVGFLMFGLQYIIIRGVLHRGVCIIREFPPVLVGVDHHLPHILRTFWGLRLGLEDGFQKMMDARPLPPNEDYEL